MANWKCSCGNVNHGKSRNCPACGVARPASPASGSVNPAPANSSASSGGQTAEKSKAEEKKKFIIETNVSPLGGGSHRVAVQYTENGNGKAARVILMGLHPTDVVTDKSGAIVDASKPVATDRKGSLLLTIQVSDAVGRTGRQLSFRVVGNQADTSNKPLYLSPPNFEVDQTKKGWSGFWGNVSAGFKHNRGGK